jgi:hypothetical protein
MDEKKAKIMKKHTPDLCLIGLIAIFYILLTFLSGCTTQKNVQREKIDQKSDIQTTEQRTTTDNTVTNTSEAIRSSTTITEMVDTCIKMTVPVASIDSCYKDLSKKITISVPVKIKRTIKKEEFGTRQEAKTEDVKEDLKKTSSIKQSSEVQILDKHVKRNNSWVLIASIIGGLVVIVAVYLIYRKIKGKVLL